MLGKIAYLINSSYTDYENNENKLNSRSLKSFDENETDYDFIKNNKIFDGEAITDFSDDKTYFFAETEENTDGISTAEKNSFANNGAIDKLQIRDLFLSEFSEDFIAKIDDELGELSLMRERGR